MSWPSLDPLQSVRSTVSRSSRMPSHTPHGIFVRDLPLGARIQVELLRHQVIRVILLGPVADSQPDLVGRPRRHSQVLVLILIISIAPSAPAGGRSRAGRPDRGLGISRHRPSHHGRRRVGRHFPPVQILREVRAVPSIYCKPPQVRSRSCSVLFKSDRYSQPAPFCCLSNSSSAASASKSAAKLPRVRSGIVLDPGA